MKTKQTRRVQFLAEMDAVVPWARLLGLIEPHYPKTGPKGGRPLDALGDDARVYFLQNWYALRDPMAEEILRDSEAMRRFAGIELGDDRIPDETTILNFRHPLERHGLTEAIFAEVNAHLADKGISMRSGSLVDATNIDAPSSTKNRERARDPEMSSTKKVKRTDNLRFPLSLRNVEDLLHERGIDICHETVRFWWQRFGPMFAAEIRRRRVHAMRASP